MSYLTVEVEIDHGHIQAKGSGSLPEKTSGLLTIFQADATSQTILSPLQALELLQNQLQLDAAGAAAWQASIGEARK